MARVPGRRPESIKFLRLKGGESATVAEHWERRVAEDKVRREPESWGLTAVVRTVAFILVRQKAIHRF